MPREYQRSTARGGSGATSATARRTHARRPLRRVRLRAGGGMRLGRGPVTPVISRMERW